MHVGSAITYVKASWDGYFDDFVTRKAIYRATG